MRWRSWAWTLGLVACGTETSSALAPGPRVVLHRLNRLEYDHTVRDLLGTPSALAREFPEDELAFGFDNQADALHLSPLHLEKYLTAAERLSEEVTRPPAALFFDGVELRANTGARYRDEGWRFGRGQVDVGLPALGPGRYRVALKARAISERPSMLPPSAELKLYLADQLLEAIVYAITDQITEVGFTFSATTTASLHLIHVGGDGVVLDWVRVDGPLAEGVCAERSCAAELIARVARSAFRRPLSSEEPVRLMALWDGAHDSGEAPERALGLAMQAVLLSPHFLFRVERAADFTGELVDDLELAARLSYFLWGSLPDEALLARAERQELNTRDAIEEEVERMLDDVRSRGLVDGFAGTWLHARAIQVASPDALEYPEFDEALRGSAVEEQARFFASLVADDQSISAVVDAPFAFVDARLSVHYGLEAPMTDFSRVAIPADNPRRGVLGQAAFLIVGAQPTRTSPVRRGKWVLGQLLCSEPPPPPPDVPSLPEGEVAGTQRQRFEAHRSRPECLGCHSVMDPIGFGLEVFDAVGRERAADNGEPIDATGELYGRYFDGPVELSAALAARPELSRCVAQKLSTYALGRRLGDEEHHQLEALARSQGWRSLIHAVTQSEAFSARRGGEP